jgi:hypothetical protein
MGEAERSSFSMVTFGSNRNILVKPYKIACGLANCKPQEQTCIAPTLRRQANKTQTGFIQEAPKRIVCLFFLKLHPVSF